MLLATLMQGIAFTHPSLHLFWKQEERDEISKDMAKLKVKLSVQNT